VGEDSENDSDGPSEEMKEAVRKRFAEIKAKKAKTLHPKERIAEEKRKKEEERRKEKEATEARIISERESNPERYEAWMKLREKEKRQEMFRHEDELILRKPIKSWRDHTVRGLVHTFNQRYKEAYKAFRTAFTMNDSDLVSIVFLYYLAGDPRIAKTQYIVPDYPERTFYQDLLSLLLGLGKKAGWFKKELEEYPDRFQRLAGISQVHSIATAVQIGPSLMLIEIANKIERYGLQKKEYTLTDKPWSIVLLRLSIILGKMDLQGETPNEYIVRWIKLCLEYSKSKRT
jgi:hypothetical protein